MKRRLRREMQEIMTPMIRALISTIGYIFTIVFLAQLMMYFVGIGDGVAFAKFTAFAPLAGFLLFFIGTLTWQIFLDGDEPRPKYYKSKIVEPSDTKMHSLKKKDTLKHQKI